MLAETPVRVSDRRTVLITVEAYETASNTNLQDLFQCVDGGWLDDVALVLLRGCNQELRQLSDDAVPVTNDECTPHAAHSRKSILGPDKYPKKSMLCEWGRGPI